MFLRETFCMKPCVVSTLGKTFTCQSSDPPWVQCFFCTKTNTSYGYTTDNLIGLYVCWYAYEAQSDNSKEEWFELIRLWWGWYIDWW